jgi:hypothetical protein
MKRQLLFALAAVLLMNPSLGAQSNQPVSSSGKEFLVPQIEIHGQWIGQEDALIKEVTVTHRGRRYRRVDVGVSGTLSGWVVKEGPRLNHFVSAPEFAFTQSGNNYRRFHGILRYEASKGSGLTIIYPEDRPDWNQKLFVTVHGSGGSFEGGSLSPWNELYNPSEPLVDISKYEKLMLDRGYAVAKTRRNGGSPGDYSVTLDSGEIVQGRNLNVHTGLLLGFTQLAENFLQVRLGETPGRTYWYGHSGGTMNGRLVNYIPGINTDENGRPIIDGFLNDDAGGGRFLPILMKDDKDTLLMTNEERNRFIRTIEISHQLYSRDLGVPDLPEWMSGVFLVNKRLTARILQEKGLGDKVRTYEVRGISHQGGEYLEDGRDGDIVILDLSRVMGALIDRLDAWVEEDLTPPPTRSDWLELSDLNGDGINENPALALPELSCPLGLYHQYPRSLGTGGVGQTGFALFDGTSLEPQDGRGVFVDMNLNRYLDQRESVEEAWQRLGLLESGESFTRSRYQQCVQKTVDQLRKAGLMTQRVADLYLKEATEVEFP